MPKPTLDAKLVLEDLRSGLDDAALMEKHNLSVKGLHSLLEKMVKAGALNESAIWIGRASREAAAHPGERQVKARPVLKDIKAGMSDGQLMRKYRLSAKGLQNLFEQLLAAGLIKESDLELGNPPMEHTVELGEEVLPPTQQAAPDTIADSALMEIIPPPVQDAGPVPPPPPPPQIKEPPATVEPVKESGEKQVARTDQRDETTSRDRDRRGLEDRTGREEPVEAVPEEQPYADTIPLMPAFEEPGTEESAESAVVEKETSETQDQEVDDDRTIEISDDTEIMPTLADQAESERAATHITVPETIAMRIQSEDSSGQPSETTVELIWKCPACGRRQNRIFDRCPECGIHVTKFRQLERSGVGADTVTLTQTGETPKYEPPREAPQDRLINRAAPAGTAKSAGVGPNLEEEVAEPSAHSRLARFAGFLGVVAVVQLVLMVIYGVVQALLSRRLGYTVDVYMWELLSPIVTSLASYLILRSVAGAFRLGIDIADTARSNNRLLRKILEITIAQKG